MTSAAVSSTQEAGPYSFASRYSNALSEHIALNRKQLFERFAVTPRPGPNLGFDPTAVAYFPEVSKALMLTDKEQSLYAKNGFVVVDHGQAYSMGSLYYGVYTRDLPVLVTTDSVLHALHRSFDAIVMSLEQGALMQGYKDALRAIHERLAVDLPRVNDPNLLAAYQDVDLYMAVARSLLEAPASQGEDAQREALLRSLQGQPLTEGPATVTVPSVSGQNDQVLKILQKIESLEVETPDSNCTRLRNHSHCIDYSQFAPRGHYTKTLGLRRYFRAMMWLGRADVGWNLGVSSTDHEGPTRELRGAALLAKLAHDAGQMPKLQAMASMVDLLIGPADSLTLRELLQSLDESELKTIEQLAADANILRLSAAIAKSKLGEQSIRSQPLDGAEREEPTKIPPAILQLTGQRFVVDAFVLSKVVYDSIDYEHEKIRRMIPMGLDVWASMGNDEAATLLVAELDRFHYAPQLFAAREVLAQAPSAFWTQSLYASWINALRLLHHVPEVPTFPAAMRSNVWQRKQLHTQLASWAELRHDTVLYAKQSYTASAVCEYPMGYVEPYPELFASLGRLAANTADRYQALWPFLETAKGASVPLRSTRANTKKPTLKEGAQLPQVPAESRFLRDFSDIMQTLAGLAKKELAGVPFSPEEQAFLKKTIDIRGGGSGPPRYDGWYPKLFFGTTPNEWAPTVADVHTSPGPWVPGVLEEGVGSAQFLMIAIDNGTDHAVYVGPVYSYYEFVVEPSKRLTDEEWTHILETGASVARPKWTSAFIAPAKVRTMGAPEHPKR